MDKENILKTMKAQIMIKEQEIAIKKVELEDLRKQYEETYWIQISWDDLEQYLKDK